jgi:TRAP transporter TAXI family solute receptor
MHPSGGAARVETFIALLDRIRRGAFLAVLAVALPALGQQHVSLTLGTATKGGGFEVYGNAVTKTIAEVDPGLVIETRTTAGSQENIDLLKAGRLDMALVQGETAHEAFSAVPGNEATLRIVAAMYPTAGMFVVRPDSIYRTIDDLRGKAVAFGARGSGLVTLARYVLDGIGLDMDRDFVPVLLDRAGDGPAMLLDGRVEALWGGGRGWPVFIAVIDAPGGGRFVAPSRDQIDRIRARHPFLQTQTLASGTYVGQTMAIESVGSWSVILARKGLPDDTVYRFCRALHLGERMLAKRLPQTSETSIDSAAALAGRRELLHPGARRYLEGQGLLH